MDTDTKKRKFKCLVDEANIERSLSKRPRKYQSGSSLNTNHKSVRKEDDTSGLKCINKIPEDNLNVVLKLPLEMLPRHLHEQSKRAKEAVKKPYQKPEHWIFSQEKKISPKDNLQNEKNNITKRLNEGKIFSRAAMILHRANKSAIGPIRKKRCPILDGLLCRK